MSRDNSPHSSPRSPPSPSSPTVPSQLASPSLSSDQSALLEQFAAVMDGRLRQLKAQLRQEMRDARQEQLGQRTAADRTADSGAGSGEDVGGHDEVEMEEEKTAAARMDRERQLGYVHNSRQSLSALATSAITATFNNNVQTPMRPPTTTQTRSAFRTRLSQGPADLVQDQVAAPVAALGVLEMDLMKKDEREKYNNAMKTLHYSVSKFHGNRAGDKDGDRTVHDFVRLINAEMDAHMGSIQMGRLNLVIGRTDGVAQTWLARKRDEVQKLRLAGAITDLTIGGWADIQSEFIAEMSKGVTNTLYEAQLKTLKLRDKNGNLDIPYFIKRFDEIAERLYPASTWTSEYDRSRMLASKFEERVKYGGDDEVWRNAILMIGVGGIRDSERTLDHWQNALIRAWEVVQQMNDGGRRGPWRRDERNRGQQPTNNKQQAAVNAANTSAGGGGDNQEEESEEGKTQGLQAVSTQRGRSGGGTDSRNPHLSAKQVAQLRSNGACLSCYKTDGHYGRDCKAPANRPPTDAELKEKAGRK